jgi:hypothetical protein
MGQSGSLRLASAYFLNPYDGTKRELIWAVTFDALPGGAAEARAVDGIRDGLIEHLPEAVAALADALG